MGLSHVVPTCSVDPVLRLIGYVLPYLAMHNGTNYIMRQIKCM